MPNFISKEFDQRYLELIETFDQKHDLIPAIEYGSLVRWCKVVRSNITLLENDQIQKLHVIGFDFGSRLNSWLSIYFKLFEFFKKNGHLKVPSNYQYDLSSWMTRMRSSGEKIQIDKRKLMDRLGFDWKLKSKKSWNEYFLRLKIYREQSGDCLVHPRWSKDPSLGSWVVKQRSDYKKGLLERDQYDLLQTLEFEWDPHESFWQEQFKKLTHYINKHGANSLTNLRFVDSTLDDWISRMRRDRECLPADKIDKLNRIGFVWAPNKNIRDKHIRELIEFKKEYGHCRVPIKWKNNPSLAQWVFKIRHNPQITSSADQHYLTEIGFDWNPHKSYWKGNLESLIKRKKVCGNNWRDGLSREDPTLYSWISRQRQLHQKNKLSIEKQKLLENFESNWMLVQNQKLKGSSFQDYLDALRDFKKSHGHCRVPKKWNLNSELANWVSRIRTQRKKGSFSTLQVQALEQIGFDWALGQEKQNRRITELKNFKSIHGHCNVPVRYTLNPELGRWVAMMRNSPSTEVKALLNELGFDWNPLETHWKANYQQLCRFQSQAGPHWKSKLLKENKKLFLWFKFQQKMLRSGKLKKERIESLKNAGLI
jgi:hypothetical protein